MKKTTTLVAQEISSASSPMQVLNAFIERYRADNYAVFNLPKLDGPKSRSFIHRIVLVLAHSFPGTEFTPENLQFNFERGFTARLSLPDSRQLGLIYTYWNNRLVFNFNWPLSEKLDRHFTPANCGIDKVMTCSWGKDEAGIAKYIRENVMAYYDAAWEVCEVARASAEATQTTRNDFSKAMVAVIKKIHKGKLPDDISTAWNGDLKAPLPITSDEVLDAGELKVHMGPDRKIILELNDISEEQALAIVEWVLS